MNQPTMSRSRKWGTKGIEGTFSSPPCLPATAAGLPEAVAPEALPPGTEEGQNDWKNLGYGGPCPPTGRHRYFHKLYALDVVLPDLEAPNKAKLERAMEGHIVAQAVLVGTYELEKSERR